MPKGEAKLKGRMVELGLTQEELARELGISKATLNAKLNGKGDWFRREIVTMCHILAIEPEHIVDYFFSTS